jgi:hypothetical protein
MRHSLCFALIAVLAASAARADIAPQSPPPPRPAGPQSAVVRGLSVEQSFARGRYRAWMTRIRSCASSQPGCRDLDVRGCLVVRAGDTWLPRGDIGALRDAVAAAGAQPVRLTLDSCRGRLNELTLQP